MRSEPAFLSCEKKVESSLFCLWFPQTTCFYIFTYRDTKCFVYTYQWSTLLLAPMAMSFHWYIINNLVLKLFSQLSQTSHSNLSFYHYAMPGLPKIMNAFSFILNLPLSGSHPTYLQPGSFRTIYKVFFIMLHFVDCYTK